jgi:replicative DNA helicase
VTAYAHTDDDYPGPVLDEDYDPEPAPADDPEPEPSLDDARPPAQNVRKLNGADFIFSSSLEVPAVWGSDGEVLWAAGESLMLVGPDGVGKTTIMQQLVLGRIGLRSELLGMPVAPAEGKVLYLAMDRPSQAARSFRRMVDEDEDAGALRERLAVWKGPPPVNVLDKPGTLADWIESEFEGVSDVVCDSLKDLAPKLSDDDVGSRINLARQELIARGIELVEGHHQRKEQRGQGAPKTLADVYGSRWLTAGAGSVVCLWGNAGDLVVELLHLKQPGDEVGPVKLVHDHRRGSSARATEVDLGVALANAGNGLVVRDVAELLYESSDPSANEIEKARYKLERLVGKGEAERRDDPDGLARYFARTRGF